MSLLTTIPEELAAAAAQLAAIVSSLTAQNAGAAAATTGLAPAASDSVSLQQAGIFSAYGTLYQQLAAEAQTVQEQFASTLGLSSGTYGSTEASNAAQAGGGNIANTLFNFLSSNNGLFSPSGGVRRSRYGAKSAGNQPDVVRLSGCKVPRLNEPYRGSAARRAE